MLRTQYYLTTYQLGAEAELMGILKKFIRDESGATSIEYGLIAALVSVAIIAALKLLSSNLNSTFSKVSNNLSSAK